MAHALLGYDGDCKNIHGHSYKLHVTVIGQPLQVPGHPKDGIVVDFKDLKKVVNENIVDIYDHALILNENTPPEIIALLRKSYDNIVVKPYQPSAENLLIEFVQVIKDNLPSGVALVSAQLWETASSYAEWRAADNKRD